MGVVKKSKTSGRWFAVNQLVRKHTAYRTALNNNADIKRELAVMNGILNEIGNQAGVVVNPGAAGKTLQDQPFPMPKIIWFGELPFDIHSSDGKYTKVHLAAFRQAAQRMRDYVWNFTEAYRMLGDAFNADLAEAPDPGGQV